MQLQQPAPPYDLMGSKKSFYPTYPGVGGDACSIKDAQLLINPKDPEPSPEED